MYEGMCYRCKGPSTTEDKFGTRIDGSKIVRKVCDSCKEILERNREKRKYTRLGGKKQFVYPNLPPGYLELAKETELRISRKYAPTIR